MLFIHHKPIAFVARADKFTRGTLLAQSLKLQRKFVKAAHDSLKSGKIRLAMAYLDEWKRERKAYKIALSWQFI